MKHLSNSLEPSEKSSQHCSARKDNFILESFTPDNVVLASNAPRWLELAKQCSEVPGIDSCWKAQQKCYNNNFTMLVTLDRLRRLSKTKPSHIWNVLYICKPLHLYWDKFTTVCWISSEVFKFTWSKG